MDDSVEAANDRIKAAMERLKNETAKDRMEAMAFLESDPNGKSQHEPGAKMDAGKNRLGLVFNGFSHALQAVGAVGTFGANKYTEEGWKAVPGAKERYTDALLRHLFKEFNGEALDQDSGLSHAAHLAWNALARLEFILEEMEDDASK